jgi:hypothetical protein
MYMYQEPGRAEVDFERFDAKTRDGTRKNDRGGRKMQTILSTLK